MSGEAVVEEKEEKCHLCKEQDITGAVFLVRLRTSTEKERVIPTVQLCDPCANLVARLFGSPEVLGKLVREMGN